MKIGLVLSGGMAKGAYQVGALRAVARHIPREDIACVSCASVGVLNGYAYQAGLLDEAEAMWRGLCCDGSRMLISQVLRSSILQRDIGHLCNDQPPLDSPFYCALLDLRHKNIVYKDLSTVEPGQLPLYLKASVAMPVYNRAVSIGHTAYFDGAMIDNIPVFPLLSYELDYIVCIYFDNACYQFEDAAFDSRVIKLNVPCDGVLRHSLVFREENIAHMIEEGYTRADWLLRTMLGGDHRDTEGVLSAIRQANQAARNSPLRVTGDLLVNNLNKLTQRLAKRRVL